MMMAATLSWALDGWIIAAGMLCAVASSLLGCFLVLRRMSMMGDAISHAVLPGLAAAFFLSESRSSITMFIGAAIVGVLTAMLTEWIRAFGKVDEGASMGVVFTTLFALGLVMIVQAADHVDLDAGCVLYGAIEYITLDRWDLFGLSVPRVVVILAAVTVLNAAFVLLFFKELKLAAFDPSLATAIGFNARLMHYLLMVLVAITVVASFESVGNILVLAMMVVPPAAAYLLTDRLGTMIILSVIIGALAAGTGHYAALVVPSWFGYRSTGTAGMMAVMTGIFFLFAAGFAPRHGIVVKWARRQRLALQILDDDILAFLYRREERGMTEPVQPQLLSQQLLASQLTTRLVLAWQRLFKRIVFKNNTLALTEHGRSEAKDLIRSHRLWEQYLVDLADVPSQHTHKPAHRLEHFTDDGLRSRLSDETDSPTVDPHGRPIPPRRSPTKDPKSRSGRERRA